MKRNVLPNLITALGLLCGLFVIFKMNMTELHASNYQLLYGTVLILLVAILADFADGKVARMMHAESEFGLVFDSISDAITFGVAPVVMVLKTISAEKGTELAFFVSAAAMLYALCGVLRLVRFSVAPKDKSPESFFVGLPIPAAAGALATLNLVLSSERFLFQSWMGEFEKAVILFVAMVFLAYLMMSKWKYFSIKKIAFPKPSRFSQLALLTFLVSIIFYGLFKRIAISFFLITWGYVLFGFLRALFYLAKGQRDKACSQQDPW